MAARIPRRSFAAPFVVTLAAAPACYVSSTPPPQQPAPQQAAPAEGPAAQPGPRPVIANPPRPQPTPAPTTTPAPRPQPTPAPGTAIGPVQSAPVAANQRWTIYQAADGSCMAAVKVECVPNATCNPPPPFKYACPTGVTLDKPQTVVASADGSTCQIEYPAVQCPPNTACNPPRPRPVSCPKP